MEIETLYDVGDTVYYMHHNKVQEDSIYEVNIKRCLNHYSITTTEITYLFSWKWRKGSWSITDVFRTKKALLNSL